MTARAWWSGTLDDVRTQPGETILERLALRAIEAHVVNREGQLRAWRWQLAHLQHALAILPPHWRLLLEYPLLRLERRLDAVLVTERAICVIEFKMGATAFTAADRAQVEDYALDLGDFHAGCRNAVIIPILVAGEAPARRQLWPLLWHAVAHVFEATPAKLPALLVDLQARLPPAAIDIDGWEEAPYRPVPTIIEAATMLYARHGVRDIRDARADVTNLTTTSDAVLAAIADAKRSGACIIVFVTGIPGAGKTLCGLNAVFGAEAGAVFLTGNLPLVHVLREALARDAAHGNASLRQARQNAQAAVQGLTGFVRDNVGRSEPPHEHVVVFDEAQRAWDAAYGARKFQLHDSEAGLFLDIMSKHADYAVIVALVGNGQEINTGEAGLREWGRALAARPRWQVRAAPCVTAANDPRMRLFDRAPENLTMTPALHLDIAVRQIRAPAGAAWVDAVLRGARDEAADNATQGIPFYVTRSLDAMRKGLRALARGRRRAGLVCSTGARRLVAEGIWPDFPHLDADAIANWFLKRWPDDVRASDALEMPATEFACQGLELDYVGLCWGGDFIWRGGWVTRKFAGTAWQYPKGMDARAFRTNTYRVLLTRARYETIIWVPMGDAADKTREPALFDDTADFLMACGAMTLPEVEVPAPEGSLGFI